MRTEAQTAGAPDHSSGARELERIPLDLPATYLVPGGATQAARVMNLSANGVFLATPGPSPVGTPVALTLQLPLASGARPLRAGAKVRWVNGRSGFSIKVPPGMGLEFLELEAAARDLVLSFMHEQWVARRRATAQGRPPRDARLSRRHFLLDFPARVSREDGVVVPARVVNVSALGAFLATEVPEPLGREVPVTLTLPYHGRLETIEMVAGVRWRNDPAAPRSPRLPPGMGLEFRRSSLANRRILEEVVSDLHMQAEGTWGL